MTENQERLIEALGLDYKDGDNAGQLIENALQGRKPYDAAFDWLIYTLGPKKVSRGTRTEYVPSQCPFCGESNQGGYVCFSFTNQTSYCYKCGGTAGVIDLALVVRNSHLAAPRYVRMPNKGLKNENKGKRPTARKQRVGQDSVWLGTFLARNVTSRRLDHDGCQEAINYFVDKGLRRPFVTRRLLPYLDDHNIRYFRSNRNYMGDKGMAFMVPYVSKKGQRVRAIKRRFCQMTEDTTAPRWNFNLYPKNENLIWSTVDPTERIYVVMVENQLDAATLQLIADMGDHKGLLAFCAPVTPMRVDMTVAARGIVESETVLGIFLAYDNDENGVGYMKRDASAIGPKAYGVTGYGKEKQGLLDVMIEARQSMGDLIHLFETIMVSSLR